MALDSWWFWWRSNPCHGHRDELRSAYNWIHASCGQTCSFCCFFCLFVCLFVILYFTNTLMSFNFYCALPLSSLKPDTDAAAHTILLAYFWLKPDTWLSLCYDSLTWINSEKKTHPSTLNRIKVSVMQEYVLHPFTILVFGSPIISPLTQLVD
jgi:hypothetical protein